MLSFLIMLAAIWAAIFVDGMALCYVVDRIGHDHHEEDDLFNRDGSRRED